MVPDFSQDYFALFGLKRAYRIDATQLDQAYHEMQGKVHPDRHAHLPETERRLSMQWATQVNEAYRTLKKPLLRAHYLLRLAGAETDHESNSWSRWNGARRWPRRAPPASTTSWKS